MDAVILRGLATRPEDRYGDMLELIQTFDLACRPGTKERTPPPNTPSVAGTGSIPIVRGLSNPALPVVQADGKQDASGRQQAVRPQGPQTPIPPVNTTTVR